MRTLTILSMVSVAWAAPQYNYQAPAGPGSGIGISQGFSGSAVSQGFGGGISDGFAGGAVSQGFGGGISQGFGGGVGQGFGGGGTGIGGGSGFGGGAGFGGGGGGYSYHGHHAPIVTKHIYVHTAPPEAHDHSPPREINFGPPRKHYKIIFIKAPAQSSASQAIHLAQAQNEEKTIIYVLSKKTDVADIQTNIQAAHHHPSKPEVYFIKYKTKEEAAHAQRTIQAQYDALGGSTQVSDEGIAPLTSVIGSVGGGHGGHGGGGHFGGGSIGGASNAYLPPN